MFTLRRQLVFAVLLAVVQLGNCNPVPMTVSKLVESNKPDKLGLANYFKELGLNKLCDVPVVDDTNFKTIEEDSKNAYLCTVIYHMFKELEASNCTNKVDKNHDSSKNTTIKFNYEMWKNVARVSPSLKLLVDSSINSQNRLNTICSNKNEVITKFCQFLNVEVSLLSNTLQNLNEPHKEENIVSQPVIKESKISSVIVLPKESTTSDSLPKTDDIGSLDESSFNDVQKPKEIAKKNDQDSVEEGNTIKDLEAINDNELGQENPIDDQIASETDSNILPKEFDGSYTITKENQMYSQKSYTNRRYGDTDDTHFLFYFGIMTVVSMLFYLILYNKKKIIALIVEGRKGKNHRRRPNTATYSKLETDDGSNVF